MGVLTRVERKTDYYTTLHYVKALQNETIRTDHPQQRESDQWPVDYRDGLISSILKDEDIPYIVICEQISDDGTVNNYLIDGIQRITTIYNFKNGIFRIGRNLEDSVIEYETIDKDKDGNQLRDENGQLIRVIKSFDIRNKGYKDLPEELKAQFNEYKLLEVKHLNCSDEKIGYHLRRYNHAKKMGESQKGVTYLNKEIAEKVKKITLNNIFFKEKGNFKPSEKNNDTFCRIVVESIMATYFINEWKGNLKSICTFLNNHITDNMINTFKNEITELSGFLNPNNSKLFNSKNSFLWLTAYHKFKSERNIDTSKFVEFINTFYIEYQYKKLNGMSKSFNELNTTGTKGKNSIINKIKILDFCMNDYFKDQKDESFDIFNYIKENINSDVTGDDIEFYEECLNDYGIEVDDINRNNLILLLAYTFTNDIEPSDWLELYKSKDNIKYTYEELKNSLDQFLNKNN